MDTKPANGALAGTLFSAIDQPTAAERLSELAKRLERFKAGEAALPKAEDYVNNHIHTTYSFSPYTPSDAVYHAWLNGLTTAGIMDHDAVAGAEEFIRAGEILGIATTVGFECRCSMAGTPFEGRRMNNPDQISVAYVTCHGIPHQNIGKADAWLAPYRARRNERNRQMVQRINALTKEEALQLDFDRDVLPLSMHSEGGGVTERHLLYALALRMISVFGAGANIVAFLTDRLSVALDEKARGTLLDENSPLYAYHLLGVLKSGMVEYFYVDATDECPHISEFTAFAQSIGAIPAYPYLGDVGVSVTGDKKAQAFEDSFLDELVQWVAQNGFDSITYMPTRNSTAQLERLIALCNKNNLFEISGEDINSPTQSFICRALEKPEFKHLIRSTWALIGHEKAASLNLEDGMFTAQTIRKIPDLQARIDAYAAIGRA